MQASEESPQPAPAEAPRRVFVYGTLRVGGRFRPQVEHLVDTQERGTIRACMYHFAAEGSRGEYPFIVRGDSVVHGEVLSFKDWERALEILDHIEGYPHFYTREVVTVSCGDATQEAQCYFIRPEAERRGLAIASGDWMLDLEIEEAE